MVHKLNDLTRAEIDAIRLEIEEKKRKEERTCFYCGKTVHMRSDQKFCSPACKTKYHNEAGRILYEALLREKDHWTREREELLKEISSLRAELNTLRGEGSK